MPGAEGGGCVEGFALGGAGQHCRGTEEGSPAAQGGQTVGTVPWGRAEPETPGIRTGSGSECRAPWEHQPPSPCLLGERLCSAEEATAGSGTYTRHGFIFSSLAGCMEKTSEDGGVSTATTLSALP